MSQMASLVPPLCVVICTGVDKWGPEGPGPPMAGQEFFFVKIEGLVEPVVLNLRFRVRSNAMFTPERRYYDRYTQNIKNNLKLSALFLQN